ncbi:hypothetical protein DEQ92_20370 [Haloferax sp. Atlit-6N]|nr:hypothetical protein DEQ92_20370 [Haloferax sp. Atlit-6N]
MEIEPAEIEMEVFDHDDVSFKLQHVPGGSFAVELSTRYSYAGRDCAQLTTLNREAAEALRDTLDEILASDSRGSR